MSLGNQPLFQIGQPMFFHRDSSSTDWVGKTVAELEFVIGLHASCKKLVITFTDGTKVTFTATEHNVVWVTEFPNKADAGSLAVPVEPVKLKEES